MTHFKAKLFSLVILFATFTWLGTAQAAVFDVTNASELQAALTDAQDNGEADTINLAAGTYSINDNGPAPFVYLAQAGENFSLTILGAGKDDTTLDGGGDTMTPGIPALIINTAGAGGDSNTTVEIQGINFSNGASSLQVITDMAGTSISNNRLHRNFVAFVYGTVSGTLNLTENMFTENATIIAQINSDSGDLTAQGNTFEGEHPIEPPVLPMGPILSTETGAVNFEGNSFNGVQGLTGIIISHGTSGATNFNGNSFSANAYLNIMAQIAQPTGTISFNENMFVDNTIQTILFLLQNTSGTTSVNANAFLGNSVFTSFSTIACDTGPIILTNNIFADNFSGTLAPVFVSAENCPVTLTNNTIANNTTPSTPGGGAFLILNQNTASADIYNNILYGNFGNPAVPADDIFVDDDGNSDDVGSPVVLSHNDVGEFASACQLDQAGGGSCVPDVTETNNQNADPLFQDTNNGNYALGPGSPAVGAGDAGAPELPSEDFNGDPLNSPPDQGALAALSMLAVSPTNIDYGDTSTQVPNSQTVTLTNNGAAPLNVLDMVLNDTTNFSLDVNGAADSCGSTAPTIDPGASCTIQVVFDPNSSGAIIATLTISTDEAGNPEIVVNLTGNGVSTGGCALGSGVNSLPSLALFMIPLGLLFWRRRQLN